MKEYKTEQRIKYLDGMYKCILIKIVEKTTAKVLMFVDGHIRVVSHSDLHNIPISGIS